MNIDGGATMNDYEALENLLKVLADKTRLKILSRIKQGELCACDLLTCLNISQPTLSHHLKILRDHNLVKSKKIGTRTHYTLEEEAIGSVHTMIDAVMDKTITC